MDRDGVIYIGGENIVSPLGNSAEENFRRCLNGERALQKQSVFEEENDGFISSIEFCSPDLTEGDKRQFLLIKLGFSSKHSAKMIGISEHSGRKARNRTVKKMGLNDTHVL